MRYSGGIRESHSITHGHKSDSYIFAIENNRLQLPLKHHFEDPVSGSELFIFNNYPCGEDLLISDQLEQFFRYDPFWQRLRWSLYLGFWLTWIVLFAFVVIFVLANSDCTPPISPQLSLNNWWNHAPLIYELWTPMFQDSDGDEIGDLRGVEQRLRELKRMGINAIFPRPFLDMDESGTGVQNFVSIEKGTASSIHEAIKFVEALHKKDMRIIIDFPMVVTSFEHQWFKRSASAINALPEEDIQAFPHSSFYTWRYGVKTSEFVSKYENRSIYYYHVERRPDLPILDWAIKDVSNAIKSALTFWIDKHVDGFHFSFIDYLSREHDNQIPEWEGILKALRNIRDHVDDYSNKSAILRGKKIFLFASNGALTEVVKKRLVLEGGLNGVINNELTKIALRNKICYKSETTVAGCANEILADLLLFHSANRAIMPIWESGNVFSSRIATRIGSRIHAEMMMMIQLLLPGINIFYYGEEIGHSDLTVASSMQFPQRGVMLWSESEPNAGFPSRVQAPFSSQLRLFKELARLRQRNEVLKYGKSYISKMLNSSFAFCRYMEKENVIYGEVIVGAVNFENAFNTLSLLDLPPFQLVGIKYSIEVKVVAVNSRNYSKRQKFHIKSGAIPLYPDEGIVFTFNVN